MDAATDTFDVVTPVRYRDLWESVWSADGMGLDWVQKIRDANGEGIDLWIEDGDGGLYGNQQAFRILDIEDQWHDVTLEQLADGYRLAKAQKLCHCGGYDIDVDDPDSCFAYIILQLAIYGELIYG